jgi:S-formylglutathione hydrolase FrmB
MALIHIGFFSNSLGMQVSCDVILPQRAAKQIGMDSASKGEGDQSFNGHPVLWLLHGASDDHTIWQRRTSIERYAAPLGLAVVMPAVQLSSYANMAHGGKYYDYASLELPEKMRGFFPLSSKREDNYIAGLSMGGSGCLKIGLANPENYAAIGCMSAGLPNFGALRSRPGAEKRLEMLYGGKSTEGTVEDAIHSAKMIIEKKLPAPRIYLACGTEDFALERARQTRDFFQSLPGNPFGYVYEEYPGAHTWEFWDEHIQDFLKFATTKEL